MKLKISAVILLALLTGCSNDNNSITKGEEALAKKDLRTATIAFKSELQKNPSSPQARLGLGKVLIKQRKFSEAAFELQNVINNENSEKSFRDQAGSLLAFAYNELREIDKLMAMPRDNYAVLYFQLIQSQEPQQNTPILNNKKTEDEFETLYNIALQKESVDLSQLLEAFSLAKNNIVKGQIALLIAEKGAGDGNMETVSLGLKKYTETHPQDAARQLQYIDFLVNAQQAAKAKSMALNLIKQNPRHPFLNELMASIYLEESDFDNALSHSRISIADNPRNVRARMVAALSEVGKQNTRSAIEHLAIIVDSLPHEHPIRLLHVDLLMQSGEYEQAVSKLSNFTPSQEDHVEQIAKMGLYLNNNNQQKLSENLLESLNEKAVKETMSLSLLRLSLNDPLALDNLDSLRKNSADSEFLNQTIAAAYLASNDFDKAESLANEWLSTESGNHYDAFLLKAIVATRKNEHERAYSLFSKMMQDFEKNPIVVSGTIESGVRAGFNDEVESLLRTIQNSDNIEMYLTSYLSAMQSKGLGDDAVALLQALKVTSHNNHLFSLKIAQHFVATGEPAYAIDVLENNKKKLSDRIDYWATLALSYQNKGDLNKAADAYLEWLKLDPKSKPALLGRVASLDNSLQTEEALRSLKEKKEIHKEDPAIYILTINLLKKHQRWEDLLQETRIMPNNFRSLPQIEAAEGTALMAQGLLKEAESKLASAMAAASSSSSEILTYLVVTQEGLGKADKAKESIEAYIKKHPKEAIGYILLGNNRGSASDWVAAETAFEIAVELGANSPLTFNNYAYSLYQNGKLDSAERFAKMAVATSPGNLSTLDTLVGIWLKMGKNKEIVDAIMGSGRVTELPESTRKVFEEAQKRM